MIRPTLEGVMDGQQGVRLVPTYDSNELAVGQNFCLLNCLLRKVFRALNVPLDWQIKHHAATLTYLDKAGHRFRHPQVRGAKLR